MPLYIRDDEVDVLARELQMLTRAASKTEAVRQALRHEIERARAATPLSERLAAVRQKARALGLPNPDFDMKKFTDELWDEG
ncbi:MAG: histidinol dehydrogenase [Alphaproteobacteria bacterium]|nr:MAG: histidinol dehydrogenase [Alphaproteobacteria bacterium]